MIGYLPPPTAPENYPGMRYWNPPVHTTGIWGEEFPRPFSYGYNNPPHLGLEESVIRADSVSGNMGMKMNPHNDAKKQKRPNNKHHNEDSEIHEARRVSPIEPKLRELEKKLSSLDHQINSAEVRIESIGVECRVLFDRKNELSQKYKEEFGSERRIIVPDGCDDCFKSKGDKSFKNLTFDDMSEVLTKDIELYLKWVDSKLDTLKETTLAVVDKIKECIQSVYEHSEVKES